MRCAWKTLELWPVLSIASHSTSLEHMEITVNSSGEVLVGVLTAIPF